MNAPDKESVFKSYAQHLRPGGARDRIAGPQLSAEVVRLAFNQWRKKLANALKALGAGELLADLGLVDLRAENVSVEQYLQIAGRLAH